MRRKTRKSRHSSGLAATPQTLAGTDHGEFELQVFFTQWTLISTFLDKIEVKEKQPKKLKSDSFSRRVWNGIVKVKHRNARISLMSFFLDERATSEKEKR